MPAVRPKNRAETAFSATGRRAASLSFDKLRAEAPHTRTLSFDKLRRGHLSARREHPMESRLLHAAEQGDVAEVRKLLEQGDDVNSLDQLGWTPLHEAAMSEPGDDDQDGPVVAQVLRTGYAWNGRVLRAAMVKVKG